MRSEEIGNKVVLIAMLCIALGLFLYFKPQIFAPEPEARLMDRLPEAEIIGRFKLLDIARETNGLLFKQKVAFREYLTYDFLLTQAKNFGLDLQKPGYFFSDGKAEWGSFVSVTDSSKIGSGIQRLEQFFSVRDTLLFDQHVKKIPQLGVYFYYSDKYLFVYNGKHLKRRLGKALFAKNGEAESSWKKFNEINTFSDENLVVFAHSDKLAAKGIDYGLMAHDSDSANFKLKTVLHANYDIKVKLKKNGPAIIPDGSASKLLNLHLDVSEFKKDKEHPLYSWLASLAKRISFPIDAFFDAWDGDLCYREGGVQLVDQEQVEMGYDDEFNQVEIRKLVKVPVRGFGAMMTVNEYGKEFINKLFAKGILTKQGSNYRFLFSPPLRLSIQDTMVSVFTSKTMPVPAMNSACSGVWMYKRTPFEFQIDSMKRRDVFGTIQFPVHYLLKRNKVLR
jgi:hypothetical protein